MSPHLKHGKLDQLPKACLSGTSASHESVPKASVQESNLSAQRANTFLTITNIDRSVYIAPRDWIKINFACEINALIEIEGDHC